MNKLEDRSIRCIVESCKRGRFSGDLCASHYEQKRKGKSFTHLIRSLTAEERFWRYVNKTNTCWLWTKYKDIKGYGKFRVNKDILVVAHRYSFELVNGIKLPNHIHLDHLCRNKSCVNPEHLEMVTMDKNLDRMLAYNGMKKEIIRLRQLLIDSGVDPGLSIFRGINNEDGSIQKCYEEFSPEIRKV